MDKRLHTPDLPVRACTPAAENVRSYAGRSVAAQSRPRRHNCRMAKVSTSVCLAALVTAAGAAGPGSSQLAFAGSEYPTFASRKILVLDGRWQFAFVGSDVPDVMSLLPTGISTPWTTVVPASFDLLAYPNRTSLAGIRGTVLFRTTINVNAGTLTRMRFGACGFYCSVFVDGVKVGEHGGNGYTSFWVGGIPPSNSSVRLLEILADNRFNRTYAPLHGYVDDWYQYGGLYRSVEWHELGPADPATVALQAVDVLIDNAAQGAVSARIRLHDATETAQVQRTPAAGADLQYAPRYRGYGGPSLTSITALPTWINVSVQFDDDEAHAAVYTQVPVTVNGEAIIQGLQVPNPTLWSPASPSMHTISVTVTGSSSGPAPAALGAGDTITDRFGLRSFTPCTSGNGSVVLCLNGEPIKLRGYGRHDTSPSLGHALGHMARMQDYLLMQGLGSNFVRIGHYTQDNSFSSLADDLGILTATEVIGWDSSSSTYKDPNWIAASIAALEEHVNNTLFNHPSIVMWAYINEGASNDPTICPTYALMNKRYKLLGVNGLTTYASDKGTGDVCFGPSGVDVPAFNIYPGWYNVGTITGNIQADIASSVALVESTLDGLATWMTATHPTLPFFVSETGAGSIPGWTDEMHGMWTQAYAARLISASSQICMRDSRWSGIALWQLMDQRVYNINEALSRPRAFNNKGTFDENRKPKELVYSAVYNAFHGLQEPDWMQAVYP